jgi:hypothetical protein
VERQLFLYLETNRFVLINTATNTGIKNPARQMYQYSRHLLLGVLCVQAYKRKFYFGLR